MSDPVPVVMHPAFSPTATMISLVAFVVAIAGDILSLPTGLLARYVPAADLQVMLDICLAVTTLAGGHMSVSRSLLPAVDNPK
jgi:hypothetical protein